MEEDDNDTARGLFGQALFSVGGLRREPTDEEHRAHAHAFVDLVFDDQAKAGAAWAAAAATKIIRFVPPVRRRGSMD
jgi:hypothetical protein